MLKLIQNIKNDSIVYAIKNTINNRIYIGSAVNAARRYSEHKNDLINNCHINRFLQNDYNKNDNQNFVFFILEILQNKNDLISMEQKWLDIFYDKQINCYNMLPIAGSHLGAKRTAQTKLKMSLASKGIKKSKSHCVKIKENAMKKAKSILQFDLDGVFIKEYESIHEATRQTNIHKTAIQEFFTNKRLTGGKFLWAYKENVIDIDQVGIDLKCLYQFQKEKNYNKKLENLLYKRKII